MTWFPWKMTRLRQLGAELDATCRGLVDRADPGRWFGVVLAVWDGNDGNHPTWLACAGRPDGTTRVIGEHATRRRAARAVYDATTGFPLPDVIRLPADTVDTFGAVTAAPRTEHRPTPLPVDAARATAIGGTWAGEGWIGG
ncbi:MAG TPA: hypothetical protein VID05_00010 [Acidimicrobiales bacterium]|jgi:hypothetical protein